MKFSDRFYKILREKSQSHGWQSTFAETAGISQDSLSKIISGKTKSPGIETVSAIIDALGAEAFLPVIRRTGAYSPEETVQGDNLPTIPVLGEAGAGPDIEIFTGEIEKTIPILPGYYRHGMWAVRVAGDSMSPLICRGAYVGVVPLDDLEDGGIYLVRKPPFGYIVKRVRMDEQGQIVLHSENPEYKPQTVPYEGYEDIIVGHVIWWWQLA